MSAPFIPAKGRAAAENELLARLGLPPSASPEDVDRLHQSVTEFLAAAPADIRGWAHAQAAALDAAYLQLTDPGGLEGSALRSPTRPPAVVPGGPATPPARRDPRPAAPIPSTPPTAGAEPAPADEAVDDEAVDDEDDIEALYASVTPSAHRDMLPDQRTRARKAAATTAPAALGGRVAAQPEIGDEGPWKRLFLGGLAVVTVLAVAGGAFMLGGGGATGAGTGDGNEAAATAPLIDEEKVAGLMAQLQADPGNTATLLALADEFYLGGQYTTAATWLDKLLAIDPEHVQALLARGAVSFNTGDEADAEARWLAVLKLEPDNAEAHYDLGFLYLNQVPPDMAGVQREWTLVIELAPGTTLAQNAQAHLDSLAASSMLPAASDAASPTPGTEASPGASAAPTPAASPAASVQP